MKNKILLVLFGTSILLLCSCFRIIDPGPIDSSSDESQWSSEENESSVDWWSSDNESSYEWSSNDYSSYEWSSDDYSSYEWSSDDYSSYEWSSDDYSSYEWSSDDYSSYEWSSDDYSSYEWSSDDYSSYEWSSDNYSSYEWSSDDYSSDSHECGQVREISSNNYDHQNYRVPDCYPVPENSFRKCTDGYDNDGDGKVDFDDESCSEFLTYFCDVPEGMNVTQQNNILSELYIDFCDFQVSSSSSYYDREEDSSDDMWSSEDYAVELQYSEECEDIYAPVCVTGNQTYLNTCSAYMDGFKVEYKGICSTR